MKAYASICLCLLVCLCFGCRDPNESESKTAEQTETSKTGIFNKTTDEIGEYDPTLKAELSDGKMKGYSPLNPMGALNAYSPTVEKLAKMKITQAINLFYAEKGRYPKDHREFMTAIIRQNKVQLPVLPGKRQYQYDVENHQLVVVMPPPKE